ncbi:MAG: transporter [Verrucomicrobiales bacterium]|nr:transporter [Verrucomicrobiales bacterium]
MIRPIFLTSLLFAASLGLALAQDTSLPLVGSVETIADQAGIDARTGAYDQPVWVQNRPFSTTRVHIQRNPYEWGVEQWVRSRENGGDWKFRIQEEISLGLPHRIQLDFYYDWTIEDSKADHLDYSGEIRWAPADWGVIPLNPAFYFEYKFTDASRGGDVIEPKILLGEDFGDGWHWGMNFIYERELGGGSAEEWAISQAISHAIFNDDCSIGMEMKWTRETSRGQRDHPEQKFALGPNFQWRPNAKTYLTLAALGGTTGATPDFEGWFVFGYIFGTPTTGQSKRLGVVSGRR